MNMNVLTTDFVILGAGVMGTSIVSRWRSARRAEWLS
jgi:hypothetical protein